MDQRTNQTTRISQSIDKAIPEIPIQPRKPSTYDFLKNNNPEHRIVVEHDAKMKVYLEKKQVYDNYFAEKKAKEKPKETRIIPDLHPVNTESFYEVFKAYYRHINKCNFDESANNKEAMYFAKTLIFYFSNQEHFFKSPLLKSINTPTMDKGLLVVGGFGTGKTSIFKAFYHLFFDCQKTPIGVYDIERNIQSLARYKFGFKYYTANQVVEDYESCDSPGEKESFWKNQNKGFTYYDDVLTERVANNYGKVEIFKDLFEKRYAENSRTMVSCNYHGDTVESTLQEFGRKYGGRVYDRLFSMFNVLELKGKSLRK